MQVERGCPGGLLQFSSSASIGCGVHLSNIPKEREAAGRDSRRKWGLLGDLANLVVCHRIKPVNVKNPL